MPRLTGIYSSTTSNDELASNAYVSSTSGGLSSGTIIMYVSDLMPGGFLLCDGSAVSRSTYSALFSAIGTTYGVGDGSTTFNLPNMKGKMPIGVKSGGNVGSLGATGGSFDHVHSMGAHTHTQSHYHSIAHTHTISHSHTINHSHTIGSHVHNANHSHGIPPHYHNASGSAGFAAHTHTSLISSGSSGSGRIRTNASPTSGTAGTSAATGWSYGFSSLSVGPNSLGDGWMTSSNMINQEAGTTSGYTGPAIGTSSTYSGSTDSTSSSTGASSVANSSSAATNTGGMTTSPNVSAANPPFLTVNFIIKT